MKVGIIAKTNQKGQIVIPKKFREALGINKDSLLNLIVRGNGIYIYPVDEVISFIETKTKTENVYLKILEKTKGRWTENWNKLRKKRRSIELSASKKRKKVW